LFWQNSEHILSTSGTGLVVVVVVVVLVVVVVVVGSVVVVVVVGSVVVVVVAFSWTQPHNRASVNKTTSILLFFIFRASDMSFPVWEFSYHLLHLLGIDRHFVAYRYFDVFGD
jgi:hypothetical protein